MNCPFCIPEIQTSVFARSQRFMAIYNIAPILPGHSLIIPEKHIDSLLKLDEDAFSGMMIFSRKITALLMKVFKAESFNWSVQEGESAGQTIAHLHIHIVLRFPGDLPDPGDWYPKIQGNFKRILDSSSRPRLTNSEMDRIVKKLREQAREEGLYDY